MNKKNFRREFSAGCVVFRQQTTNNKQQTTKYLIGKHSGYHKWVLPKGLIEKGEKGWETGLRETEEEMGVRAKLVDKKSIHREQYMYYADYKDKNIEPGTLNMGEEKEKSRRRVDKYEEEGGKKTKVFKTVSFYLAKYESGSPKNHGWEMEDAGWYEIDEALGLMAFDGEKEALEKAKKRIKKLQNRPKLL